eukprot:gene1787-929_t
MSQDKLNQEFEASSQQLSQSFEEGDVDSIFESALEHLEKVRQIIYSTASAKMLKVRYYKNLESPNLISDIVQWNVLRQDKNYEDLFAGNLPISIHKNKKASLTIIYRGGNYKFRDEKSFLWWRVPCVEYMDSAIAYIYMPLEF